jgi:hypothetical protein
MVVIFVVVFGGLSKLVLEAPPLCNRPNNVSRHEISDDAQSKADVPVNAKQLNGGADTDCDKERDNTGSGHGSGFAAAGSRSRIPVCSTTRVKSSLCFWGVRHC